MKQCCDTILCNIYSCIGTCLVGAPKSLSVQKPQKVSNKLNLRTLLTHWPQQLISAEG